VKVSKTWCGGQSKGGPKRAIKTKRERRHVQRSVRMLTVETQDGASRRVNVMRRRIFWHSSRCTLLEKERKATIIPSPCCFGPHRRRDNHQTKRRKPNCRSAAHVPHWSGAASRKHDRQRNTRRGCGRRWQMAHRGERLKHQASTRYRKRNRVTPSKHMPIHRAPAIVGAVLEKATPCGIDGPRST